MSSRSRKRRKHRNVGCNHDTTHALPGHLVADHDSHPTSVNVFAYGPQDFVETEIKDPSEIPSIVNQHPVTWIAVQGLGDTEMIAKIGKVLGLHELPLEDAMCPLQRAKVEQYNDQLFVVFRCIEWKTDQSQIEQISIFLTNKFLVTFQETPESNGLSAVKDRLRKGAGHLRAEGPDYLMYSVIDAVIDGYFPVVEGLGDLLDQLEDDILDKVNKSTPGKILDMKREVLTVRRAVWPSRDAVNALMRDDMAEFIKPRARTYLRDCYDHVNRIIDLVETHREMCADLMDLYLSSVSNRMNQVMKVLTTITLLFMPPSLIAGIYGMNFDRSSPVNMPELSWHYGYIYALLLMLLCSIIIYQYGRHHGWLQDSE